MRHKLTQEPDTSGYEDGLEDWTCTCGLRFSAGEIDAAFEHGREATSNDVEQRLLVVERVLELTQPDYMRIGRREILTDERT